MTKRVFTIFILTLLFLFSSPVYSLDTSSKTLEKYTKKISSKFTRTYCNTTNFGISYEGALAFAIGETNKEFKNNKLNKLIDYSLLKKFLISSLELTATLPNSVFLMKELWLLLLERLIRNLKIINSIS